MADREDDRRIGVNSSALFFGERVTLAIALAYVGTLAALTDLGIMLALNPCYWISLALAAAGWAWQSWRLRSPQLASPVYGQIFGENVWLGFGLLLGMILGWV